MAQYDVYRLKGGLLVCDIQSDILYHLETATIIPLLGFEGTNCIRKLNPIININDKDYVLKTEQITAIPKLNLSHKITNISEYHYDMTNAVDFLFHGF